MLTHGSTAGLVEHHRKHTPVCEPCLTWAIALEADHRASYYARLRREDEEMVREFLTWTQEQDVA